MRRHLPPLLVGSFVPMIVGSCWGWLFSFSDPDQGSYAMLILLGETAMVGAGIGLITSLLGMENLIAVALCALSGWMIADLLLGVYVILALYGSMKSVPGLVVFPIEITIGIVAGSFPAFLIWAWKRRKKVR